MQIVAVTNSKGGCGKTTTAINLAAALVEAAQRVVLVDLDPQAHATLGAGHAPSPDAATAYHLMVNEHTPVSDIAVPTAIAGLDLIPADARLAEAAARLGSMPGRHLILGEQLRSFDDYYDACVIDCAPSHDLLTTAALVAATAVLVPVQARSYAFTGLDRLLTTIERLPRHYHPCATRFLGFLLTLFEARTTLSKQTERDLRAVYGDHVLQTVIHKTVAVAEAPSRGRPVLVSAPKSKAAAAFRALGREVLARLETPEALTIPAAKPLVESHAQNPPPVPGRRRRVEPPA